MERSTSIMSHETLRRIAENDPTLITLVIAHESINAIEQLGYKLCEEDGLFDPNNRAVLGKLGESIAKNTALKNVYIHGQGLPNASTRSLQSFFDGFKRNASVKTVGLVNIDLSRGTGYKLVKSFQDRCHPLGGLCFTDCDVGSEIASTLSAFKHIEELNLFVLSLGNNNIGRFECDVLSTILKDPHSNLLYLKLDQNNIDDSCCIALADALKKNNKLLFLHLNQNPQISETGMGAFANVLCDTNSINATYLSNHTLEKIACHEGTMSNHLTLLLSVNSQTDKRFIAMQKVLKFNPNLNMAPVFEWDLKVLPHLVDWFGEFSKKWKDSFPDRSDEELEESTARLTKRKLSVMYQFVRAMPLKCVPNRSHRGVKRKLAE